jgi:catechol 2,3-dioxygenase-like lactoylglutathione lyase family enzyme
MSLGKSEVMAFVATTNPEKSKAFYTEVLGLKLVEDAWFAIVLMAGNTRLHIEKVKEFTPQPFTVLGWQVRDIAAMVASLAAKGVKFERYPGLEQDAAGIWTTPDGVGKVAWFRDPDGNTLSLTQFDRG